MLLIYLTLFITLSDTQHLINHHNVNICEVYWVYFFTGETKIFVSYKFSLKNTFLSKSHYRGESWTFNIGFTFYLKFEDKKAIDLQWWGIMLVTNKCEFEYICIEHFASNINMNIFNFQESIILIFEYLQILEYFGIFK